MSNTHSSRDFQNAANYLSSASSLVKVSSSTKLELYGLFKYVTSSKMPLTSRPSIFDMTGRAKWDAWSAIGKKYENATDVEQRYLELARNLGWTGSAVISAEEKRDSSVDDDSIWDLPDEPSGSGGGGGGMGVSVSSMAQPQDTNDSGIHGLVLSNNVSGLKTFLTNYPDTNLNALDEFGYAPLHLACDRGNVEVVKILLNKGADRTIKDPDELTPLELSQEAGHSEIEKLLVTTS